MQPLTSKLPGVGTTIFTVMSKLAEDCDAINLSQGFPDFQPPVELLDRVSHHLSAGHNQYPPMTGVTALRQQIAVKVERLYGVAPDVTEEITVTSGATEALFCAIHAIVRAGEEVVVFDPAYDSYDPAIRLAGAKPEAKIVPFRGEYYELNDDRTFLVRNLIYPVPDPRFPFTEKKNGE